MNVPACLHGGVCFRLHGFISACFYLYVWALRVGTVPESPVLHTVPGTWEALRNYLLSEYVCKFKNLQGFLLLSYFFPFFFIKVKFTLKKLTKLSVQLSGAWYAFTMLYNHHLHLVPKCFHHPKKKPRTH